MKRVEIAVLLEGGRWYSKFVDIPEDVADKQSHDEFERWLVSDEGDQLMTTLGDGVVDAHVVLWNGDILDDEPMQED